MWFVFLSFLFEDLKLENTFFPKRSMSQHSVQVFQIISNLFKLVQTCQNWSKLVKIGLNLSKLVKPCLNWSKLVQICSKVFKLVQTCSDLSKMVQTYRQMNSIFSCLINVCFIRYCATFSNNTFFKLKI